MKVVDETASVPVEAWTSKVAHVKSAKQTRTHECHWPGCGAQVPPALWGCKAHWFRLPRAIRRAIWAAYRSGQEQSGDVSKDYAEAARAAQDWIARIGNFGT